MKEVEMIRRVQLIVDRLGKNQSGTIPYCSKETLWQVNKMYLRSRDMEELQRALTDNVGSSDRIQHMHYSVQRVEKNVCAVFGKFCVADSCDGNDRYGFAYDITVLFRNGLAERIMLHGNRNEPVFWIIQRDEDHIFMLRESEIVYVESSHNDLIWHCREGDFEVRGSLKDMEKKMSAPFFRIHRGYVINAKHIKSISQREITMDNGDKLWMPFRSYRRTCIILQNYLRENILENTDERNKQNGNYSKSFDK